MIVLESWQCWGMQDIIGWRWCYVVLEATPCRIFNTTKLPCFTCLELAYIRSKSLSCLSGYASRHMVSFNPVLLNYHIIIIALVLGCWVVNLIYTREQQAGCSQTSSLPIHLSIDPSLIYYMFQVSLYHLLNLQKIAQKQNKKRMWKSMRSRQRRTSETGNEIIMLMSGALPLLQSDLGGFSVIVWCQEEDKHTLKAQFISVITNTTSQSHCPLFYSIIHKTNVLWACCFWLVFLLRHMDSTMRS